MYSVKHIHSLLLNPRLYKKKDGLKYGSTARFNCFKYFCHFFFLERTLKIVSVGDRNSY